MNKKIKYSMVAIALMGFAIFATVLNTEQVKADIPSGTEVRAMTVVQRITANEDGTLTLDIWAAYIPVTAGIGIGIEYAALIVILDGTETPIEFNRKMTGAVLDYAHSLGYILNGNGVIVPSFERGVN